MLQKAVSFIYLFLQHENDINFLSDGDILDEEISELSENQTPDLRSSDRWEPTWSPTWSIEDDVCWTLKPPPTGLLNIKASDLG